MLEICIEKMLSRFLRQLPEPLLSSEFEMLVKECTCDWKGICQCTVRAKVGRVSCLFSPFFSFSMVYNL